ncbi:C-type mannose receptor 2-like [Falco biarmicus]|uniref:C-type mannose receptor 2-like n=1 Tax=Falco peregrinus TaxID=8954 RepID=UPI000FFC68DA|nr:C-type mannose receptor 2-like [Falco peregrinus]XP_027655738.1 C-type lectin domain family 4 member K [Falco cherrug]XP_056201515.1 C-type mannose receptor 2-like [Falco biarmicus]
MLSQFSRRMCRARQNCGKHGHSWWQPGPLCCLTPVDYLAREARGGSYWIGLVATGPGGSWRWVDRAAYSQAQSFWAPGQPDRTDYGPWGQESCAQIHPVGNGLWNDHNCNFTFPWICKKGPECDLTPATLPAPHPTPPCQMSPPGTPSPPWGRAAPRQAPMPCRRCHQCSGPWHHPVALRALCSALIKLPLLHLLWLPLALPAEGALTPRPPQTPGTR